MIKTNWQNWSQGAELFYDPLAQTKSKIATFNADEGKLEGYACTECNNKGLIAYLKEDNNIGFRDCRCRNMRIFLNRVQRSGLNGNVLDKTFDNFQAKEPWQQRVKEGAMAYAADPKGWFLLCGQSGSGKSHLCTAICLELLQQGKEVYYMPWRNDAPKLKYPRQEDPDWVELMNRVKQVPVLYIDDLFKAGKGSPDTTGPTKAEINLAYDIISCRYNSCLTTIVSTEIYSQALVKIDEAVGSRLVEMAGEHVYNIKHAPGRNYRLRKTTEI